MSLDKVAPLIPISFRPDKPKISLKRDTLEAMASRDASRRSGNRTNFKVLRNKVNRLVKRDKIRGVLSHLEKNLGSQQAWIEANTILGRGRGNKLPSCTNNKDPVNTANHQNNFFIEKVDKLVASLPSGCQNDADDEKSPNVKMNLKMKRFSVKNNIKYKKSHLNSNLLQLEM